MSNAARPRLGPYELSSPLGAGGMGEVFRARDARLNRDVAVKVLPGDFVADADRLRRFEQEARTLAALNHPNILTIHDAGVHEGRPYLVSELLEGRTLREELGAGTLSTRRATDYALQIAQGLAAAHSKGIIHRDLKPENLFITRDGRVKILDFGLAKLRESPKPTPTNPEAPTVVQAAATAATESTEPGKVMGTPNYMAPEQVRGEAVDHRADLFAFGCVLYELVSGQRPFKRDTSIATMAAIMNDEPPDLATARPDLSPALVRIVHRCLEKQPDNRFQSAKDLAFALEGAAMGSSENRVPAGAVRVRRIAAGMLVFVITVLSLLTLAAGILIGQFRTARRLSTAPSIRYLTYSGRDYSPSASADGKRLCFSSDRDGTNRIWVKDIATSWETPLTAGPDNSPRFSRDGSMVLFTRSLGGRSALFRVPSIGGEPSKIVGVDGSAETVLCRIPSQRCSAPRWSPDGRTIAVALNDKTLPQSLAVISIETGQIKNLPAPHRYNWLSSVAWDGRGRNLFYMQAETAVGHVAGSTAALFRHSVSTAQFQKLLWSPVHGTVLDVLPSGNLVLDARSSRQNLKELPLGTGGRSARSLTLGNSTDRQPVYSPDGNEIAFASNRSGNLELWSISRKTGIVRPLTDDPGNDWDPGFSPDGRKLIWSSNRSGNFEIWIANADGTAPTQVTQDGFSAENPTMTRDGQWIVYVASTPGKEGFWKIHPNGTGAVRLIKAANPGIAQVSHDGKYVAHFEELGRIGLRIRVFEVESGAYVPFEIRIDVVKETVALLGRPRWMPDDKAIAFLGQDARGFNGVYAQDFVPGRDTSGTRRPLGGFDPENSAESFDISPDGQSLTIATWEQFFSIMMTEDLPSD